MKKHKPIPFEQAMRKILSAPPQHKESAKKKPVRQKSKRS